MATNYPPAPLGNQRGRKHLLYAGVTLAALPTQDERFRQLRERVDGSVGELYDMHPHLEPIDEPSVREYVLISIFVETGGQYLLIGDIVDGNDKRRGLNPRRLNEDLRAWGRRRDELERKLRLTPEARAALKHAGRQTIDLHEIRGELDAPDAEVAPTSDD
jgi:hypothetical protein